MRQRCLYDSGNVRVVKQTISDGAPDRVHLYVFPGDYDRSGLGRNGTTSTYDGSLTLGTETQSEDTRGHARDNARTTPHLGNSLYDEYPPGGGAIWYEYDLGPGGGRMYDVQVGGAPANERDYFFDGLGRVRSVGVKRWPSPGVSEDHLITVLYDHESRPILTRVLRTRRQVCTRAAAWTRGARPLRLARLQPCSCSTTTRRPAPSARRCCTGTSRIA